MSSILKIKVDLQCQVFCDFEQIGEAQANSIFKMELRKGTYILEFKKEGLCLSTIKYKIESNDEDDLLEIHLFDTYCKEIDKIKRKEISKKEVIWFYTGDNWRLIDTNDEVLNPLTKESWIDLPVNYNLLPMESTDVDMCGYIPFNIGGKLYHDDLAGYSIHGGKWGCLNKLGEIVIPPIHDDKVFFKNDQITAIWNCGVFSGIINSIGERVFQDDYDSVFPINERLGLYQVVLNKKYGIIDKYGKIIIPINYSKFGYYTNEMIWAQENLSNKWGLIKYDSTIIQPFIYDEILKANEGYYVSSENKWGAIDDNGNIVINTLYTIVAKFQNHKKKSDDEILSFDNDIYNYIYYHYTLVKKNGKYGVINTNLSSLSLEKNEKTKPLIFNEIIPCKYDAVYSLFGGQYTDEDLVKQTYSDSHLNLSAVCFVEKFDYHMQCDKYSDDGAIIYSFICDEFNDKYKILSGKYFLKNENQEYDSESFDLISSIDFYNGTVWEKAISPNGWDGRSSFTPIDITTLRHKISFLIGKKDTEWYIFDDRESNLDKTNWIGRHYENRPTTVLFTYKCDKIVEFGILLTGEYFAIVEIENYKKLFIILNSEIIYESDYMIEVHSSYDLLTHSDKTNNEKYLNIEELSNDYFIVRLNTEKWQVLKYDYTCINYGVDIFKSPEFDFIRFINESKVEVHIYHNGRTLYNTMSTSCGDNMKPDSIRWKLAPYEERNCNWVAVYDFETDKEGVVIEEHDKLSEIENPVYGGYNIIGKIPEEIIIPFKWDYARMFYSERNPIIAVGNYTDNKVGDFLGAVNELRCAIMDTRKHFLSYFIFDCITTGFSCQDLSFHIGGFIADINLVQDDLIYSIPFLNYESYDKDGRYFKGSPFKNVRLFIDTETTGLPLNDKAAYTNLDNWPYLVQVALIIEDDNYGILAKRNIILKPDGYSIPESSARIHGISNTKAVKEGEDRKQVICFLDTVLYNSDIIIGHNILFDLNVVKAEITRVKGIENALFVKKEPNIMDTMKMGTNVCKIPNLYFYSRQDQPYKYPKLDELYYKLFHKHFDDQHDAMSDIQATYDCYYELKKNPI